MRSSRPTSFAAHLKHVRWSAEGIPIEGVRVEGHDRERLEAAIQAGEQLLTEIESGTESASGMRHSTAMALFMSNGQKLMASVYRPDSAQVSSFGNYGHTPDNPDIGYASGLRNMIDALHVAVFDPDSRGGELSDGAQTYSVEQVRQHLDSYLVTLYEMTNGGLSLDWPHQDDVSRKLGIQPQLGDLVAQRLKDDGLVNFETFGPTLSITKVGRDRVESLRARPQVAAPPEPRRHPILAWIMDTLAGRSGFIRAIAFWVILAAAVLTIIWAIWTMTR